MHRLIVEIWHADYRKHGYGRLATVDKATQRVIGFCGLKYLDDLKVPDIGYRFLPEYWGRGLATEAALATMQYGREQLGLDNVIGMALPENLASRRVLQKIGLREAECISLDDAEVVVVYR